MTSKRTGVPIRKRRKPSLAPDLLQDWDDAMEELRAVLRGRPRGARGQAPWDNWSGRIRSHIYALVRRYKAQGKLRIIDHIVAALEREPLTVSIAENPYYWALYAARFDGEIEILTNKDLSRFSRQMLYADRHDIDAALLVGFVYQQGNEASLVRKLVGGEYEPWAVPNT